MLLNGMIYCAFSRWRCTPGVKSLAEHFELSLINRLKAVWKIENQHVKYRTEMFVTSLTVYQCNPMGRQNCLEDHKKIEIKVII